VTISLVQWRGPKSNFRFFGSTQPYIIIARLDSARGLRDDLVIFFKIPKQENCRIWVLDRFFRQKRWRLDTIFFPGPSWSKKLSDNLPGPFD
jgi:hypothetical protein